MAANEVGLSNRKKRLLKIILPLFILLILCTFLSRTIAGMFVPTVHLATVEPGSLSSVADFKGIIKYEGVEDFSAQSNWTITKIHVNENQAVKKGDLLFEIDMDQANILILQQRASIKQMEEKKKKAQTTQDAAILQLQLEAETQKLALLEKQYPADGKMIAQQNGTITGIQVEEGQMVEQGELLMTLIPEHAQPAVEWEMDLDSGAVFGENDKVTIRSVSYDYVENQTTVQELDSTLAKKNFQPSTNLYSCKALLPSAGAVTQGKPVDVRLTKESSPYDVVVPTSGLLPHESDNQDMGNVYILETEESLFGTQYVVKKIEVSILDRNNLRAAVSGRYLSPGSEVIADVGSLPIQDGSVVKVERT